MNSSVDIPSPSFQDDIGNICYQRFVVFCQPQINLESCVDGIYYRSGGLKITERFFVVPLDYSKPDGHKLRIFARHVVPSKKAKTKDDEEKLPFRKQASSVEHKITI